MSIPKKRISPLLLGAAALLSATLSLPGVAAVPDGKPSFDPATNANVYAWRASNGTWRIRLTAGGDSRTFSGSIESSQAYNWVGQHLTEAHDDVNRTAPRKLDLDMKVWGSGEDGVNLSIPDGSKLCLRGSGISHGGWKYTKVIVGANNTPMNTPVDLTGNGACTTTTTTTNTVTYNATNTTSSTGTTAINNTGMKYNPGHYISMNRYDKQAKMLEAVKPGVTGIQKRYMWITLEPTLGNYDFSEIQSDLNLLSGQGMKLVVLLEDKTFVSDKPTPPYLWNDYTIPTRNGGGYIAKRWDPYVVRRMKALVQKLGERFDKHPNFEGIAFQESSLSISDFNQKLYGYNATTYRDSIIEVLKSARASFPNSQVFWYMNFLEDRQDYIGDIAKAIQPYNIAMGGPDVLPDAWTLQTHCYPYYDQFKGKMTLFNSMQYDSYDHAHKDTSYPTKYWTMGEMFRFARDQLHTSYLFWNRKTARIPSDSYNWLDALNVIERNPRFNQ